MLLSHLKYLTDPNKNKDFQIKIFEKKGEHIESGELYTDTSTFPIIRGVPRILLGKLRTTMLQKNHEFYQKYKNTLSKQLQKERANTLKKETKNTDKFSIHQQKTADSFGYERNTIYNENNYEKENFIHFLGGYLKPDDFTNKICLDVGCGSGRFTKQVANCHAKISIGIDLSEAVDLAYKLTKDQKNTLIIQGDIYNLPFKNNIDITFSIGVLHHLPNPQKGFNAIVETAPKNNGQVLIRVYARKNNKRALYLYEPLRLITKHINKKLLYHLCHFPAILVHMINLFTIGIEKIGWKTLAKKMPFYYYTNFPYNMKHNDAFDVLATPKSNYYDLHHIQERYDQAKLTQSKGKYLKEAGLTFIGNK